MVQKHEFLGEILIRKGLATPAQIKEALSEQFHIPVVSLRDSYIDWELVKKFSSALVFDCGCIPISQDDISITFAVNNPLDTTIIKKAEEETRAYTYKTRLVLATRGDIEEVLTRYKDYVKNSIFKKLE